MRILVTGGCGFIGSFLVKKLVNLGFDVAVLDNLSSGSLANLGGVVDKVRFIEGDVRKYGVVLKALKDVDVVYHLAALTSVQESIRKPMLYHEVNSKGTLNLLKASVENKIKKFIYASSCAVYGNPVKLPISEDHPTNPLSPYAASKLSAEAYCKAYSNAYGLHVLILRLFNVYGPKQSENYAGVIIEFIRRVKNNEPPVIFGDGEQTRDFIYVSDVVEYFTRALNYKLENNFCEIFNIGTGKPITINQLANLVLQVVEKRSLGVVYKEPKKGDIRHSVADISKAVNHLMYVPSCNIEEGLRKMLEFA